MQAATNRHALRSRIAVAALVACPGVTSGQVVICDAPTLEWQWTGSARVPHRDVYSTPLVGDVDADGIPEVLFPASSGRCGGDGVVVAVSGCDGFEKWVASQPEAHVNPLTTLAMADIDFDGKLEIVSQSSFDPSRLVALDDDGSFLWLSDVLIGKADSGFNNLGTGAAIGDLDADGVPEITWGINAFRTDGTYFWTPEAGGWKGTTRPDGNAALSVIADVDGDGRAELVAGPTAYTLDPVRRTGRILWTRPDLRDGWPAIADLDGDGLPDVVVLASNQGGSPELTALHGASGTTLWSLALVPTWSHAGPPVIADVDGGAPEILLCRSDTLQVVRADGTLGWSAPISDSSSGEMTAAAYDLEGDGAIEVVVRDQEALRILRGADGAELSSIPAWSCTWIEGPTVADVDGDCHADIVYALDSYFTFDVPGIRVVSRDDRWRNARSLWNQHSYHVTNIEDSGLVPAVEPPSWLSGQGYRAQAAGSGSCGACGWKLLRNDAVTDLRSADLRAVFAARAPLLSLDLIGPDCLASVGEGSLTTSPGSEDDDDFYASGIRGDFIDPDPVVASDPARPLVFYELDATDAILRVSKAAGIRLTF